MEDYEKSETGSHNRSKPDFTLHSPENIFHVSLTRKQIEYIIAICQNDEMDWGDQEMADEVAESLQQQTGIY